MNDREETAFRPFLGASCFKGLFALPGLRPYMFPR